LDFGLLFFAWTRPYPIVTIQRQALLPPQLKCSSPYSEINNGSLNIIWNCDFPSKNCFKHAVNGFATSIHPFVWGWQVSKKTYLAPNSDHTVLQKWLKNIAFLSKTMYFGVPSNYTTSLKKIKNIKYIMFVLGVRSPKIDPMNKSIK
jgi:hypothetical protein